jgi:hypothetical protein
MFNFIESKNDITQGPLQVILDIFNDNITQLKYLVEMSMDFSHTSFK